jgi:putative hydrolase of the HAD superfamily
MAIRVLMVDVDGVVVTHPDPRGWSANLQRDLGLDRGRLQAAFFRPHFADVVHGRAALRARLGPVLSEIAPHLTCGQLIDYWFANDAHLDTDLLDQLADVRARGIQLQLATVQEHERARYLWHDLGLRHRFDAIHYAADIGWAKPADEFFAAIEQRSGFAPAEIAFIDDKPDNVTAARQRGWTAEIWTGERPLGDVLPSVAVTRGNLDHERR